MSEKKRGPFNLYREKPLIKMINGSLSVDHKGDASFWIGDGSVDLGCAAEMVRARIEWAGSHTIKLSGMAPCGMEKNRLPKYRYEEWFLHHDNGGAK